MTTRTDHDAAASNARRLISGYTLLVVTALGWAGAWLTARVAAHDAPPLSVALGRFIIAALALLPVWWLVDRRKRIRLSKRDCVVILGMSCTGITTYTVLFMLGVSLAPASDGAVITAGLTGVFAILFAWLFSRQRPSGRVLAGMLFSLGGTLLVGWSAVRAGGISSARVLGDLIFLFSAAALGGYTVLGKALSGRVPPITVVLLASMGGVVVLAPLVILWDGYPDVGVWSAAAMFNVIYLGLIATAVSYSTYYMMIHLIGIGRAAPAFALVPFFAILGAAFFLGETLTSLHIAGGILVIAGIVIPAVQRRDRLARKDPDPC